MNRLRVRKPEIEQALLARITSLPDASGSKDPEYRAGIRSIIPAAFDFGLAAIESRDGEIPPVPAELAHQARLAARHRVGLDTVLRGYVAGSALIDDFMLEECGGIDVQPLLRSRALAFEHLLSRVSEEHRSACRLRDSSREARALERVRQLLRGESQNGADLGYPLEFNHVGIVARGGGSREMIVELARSVDSRLLLVGVDRETVLGWLGRRGNIHAEEVQEYIAARKGVGVSVGIGEPGGGLSGWRQTHQQAKAALPVAVNSSTGMARYADVCLIASAMQDPLLTSSLRELYLQPLLTGRDNGAAHLQTLRTYFIADRNGESTASALGISRQAVGRRLRVIEEQLGQPLASCASAVEVALVLEELRAG